MVVCVSILWFVYYQSISVCYYYYVIINQKVIIYFKDEMNEEKAEAKKEEKVTDTIYLQPFVTTYMNTCI